MPLGERFKFGSGKPDADDRPSENLVSWDGALAVPVALVGIHGIWARPFSGAAES